MNQEIGITLKLHGMSAVESSFLRLDSLIDGLANKLSGLARHATGLEKLSTSLSGFGKSGSGASSLARGIEKATISMEKGVATLDRYTESLKRYGQVAASLPAPHVEKGSPSGNSPGVGSRPVSSKEPSSRERAQSGLNPYGFMARYWIASGAYNAARHGLQDIGLGYSREKLTKPLENLMAVDMNTKQRRVSEMWARGFARKIYAGGNTTEKSLDALAEVLSAAGPDDRKWRSIRDAQKAAESGIMYGIVSQQSSSQALKQLMSATHAQYFALPDKERLKYETGEKSFGALIEQTGAKLAKIVQISSIWGPDTARFLQYGLVSALDKGMNLDQILAIAGTTKTAGIPGQKAGRGLKSILEGEIGKFAALSYAGDEDPTEWTKYKALDPKQREALRSKRQFELLDKLRDNPFGFLDNLNKWLHTAESRKIDVMRSGIGLSKDWINYERLLARPGTVEASREAERSLSGTNDMRAVRRRIIAMQEGEKGYLHSRLSNAWDALTQSWAQNTPGQGAGDAITKGLYRMSDIGKDGKGINPLSVIKEFYQMEGDVMNSLLRATGVMKAGSKAIQIDDLIKAFNGVPTVINEAIGSWTSRLGGFVDHVKGNVLRDWNSLKQGIGSLFAPKHPHADAKQVPKEPHASGIEGAEWLPKAKVASQGGTDLELQGAAAQILAMASGQPREGSAPNIRVFIGDREIKDIVVEAVGERQMENRNKWGNPW